MPRLIWTPSALRDLQRLYRFLGEKSSDAARRAARAIRDGVKILADHPGVGRPIEDMAVDYREWLIDFGDSGYVVMYRYDADQQIAVILAIRHQREAGY